MLLALELLWLGVVFELALQLLPPTRLRQLLAASVAVYILVSLVGSMVLWMDWWQVLFVAVGLYRTANITRLVVARIAEAPLRVATLRTSLRLLAAQAILTLIVLLPIESDWVNAHALWLIVFVQVGAGTVLLLSTIRQLVMSRRPKEVAVVTDRNLPTLTVAVPARNETRDLEECLTSLIASNYPKLEILVLDDCSQHRHTAEVIRDLAHAGVRFLEGEVPPANWLAKNHAYEQLYAAASGELVLFCGVDARFSPSSLRVLVETMLQKKKRMMSIVPRNIVPPFGRAAALIQTMRYAWEFALPRRVFNRPPILSTCWMIYRSDLAKLGGFAAVSRSAAPESYFARHMLKSDGYSFMQSGGDIDITSNKSLYEQHSTAVRTEYPKLRRRPENVLLITSLELASGVLPYILVILGLTGHLLQFVTVASAVAIVLHTLIFALVMTTAYRQWLTRGLWVMPFAVLLDVILLNESMLRYEFFSVIWKERNVCVPVMQLRDVPASGQ